MAKATKRTRAGRRVEQKSEARFPLRRPALLAALGLAGWAPAGAAFPPTLDSRGPRWQERLSLGRRSR